MQVNNYRWYIIVTHVSLITLENLFLICIFFFDFLSATILYFFLYPLKVSLLSTTNITFTLQHLKSMQHLQESISLVDLLFSIAHQTPMLVL